MQINFSWPFPSNFLFFMYLPISHIFNALSCPCIFFTGPGATRRSYRRQDGADAAARFEKFLPARVSLRPQISQICNRETRGHDTPCTKTTDSYPSLFLYDNTRKIHREMMVGEIFRNNGRRKLNWVSGAALPREWAKWAGHVGRAIWAV